MFATGKIRHVATIFYSICGEWMGLMSGGFSVLFTAAAFYFEGHERRIFVFLAFLALWACVFRLAYKNYPQFKLACSKDIDLCATPKNAQTRRYFRLLISTKCVNGIEHCSGNLEKIEKEGIVIFQGDATVLPFSKPEERADIPILMKPEIEYWLDILVTEVHRYTITELSSFPDWQTVPPPVRPDKVLIATKQPYTLPKDINGQYVFGQPGEYILYVSVSGKAVPTAKAKLKFTWTGKANDSTIEMIK